MSHLLDTNHWSFLQRNHPKVVAHIRLLPNDAVLYMPVIAEAELLAGVALVAHELRRHELRNLYERAVATATAVLPIDSKVAEVLSGLRRRGRPIETNDMWIAAIALVHGLIVVSNDEHFKFIEDLRVEDWTK